LCSYLIHGNSCAIQTPFKDIYELPPACSLKITKNERKTDPFWHPMHSYKTSIPKNSDVVEVLQNILKPWIEPYKNICVSLSGGLDSSSLVYCLKNIKKEEQTLSALNYFHSSVKSSNELIYARKICQQTGIELIEIDVSSSLPFDLLYKKQPLNPNKPFPGLLNLRWLETIYDSIPSTDPCIFLNGRGSDHIFMCPPSKKSISDYILEKGLKGVKDQLKNMTQFYRDPFSSIFKENAKSLSHYFLSWRQRKRCSRNTQNNAPNWIAQEVYQKSSPNFIHPIYECLSSRIPPGKYEQIDTLYEGLASILEVNKINPTFYPYFYKPMVELALSFPTYNLFKEGYDRYPLRKAISDRFQTDTVWRRDKSQITGVFQLGVKKNIEYVLDLCLEGQFAKHGFIDRKGLYKTITLIAHGDLNHIWPFMNMASAEIFLKHWK